MRLIGLIMVVVGLLASAAAGAQSVAKIARVGVLWQVPPPPPAHPYLAVLLERLQELGWQEGKTIALENRYGGGDAARLDRFAEELVRMKVDVIATAGDVSTRAAQKATRSIPIVALVGFPVESGFVASLARPGGNITGVAVIADQASAKRLELLKELFPQLRRVAVLWDPVTHERQPQAVAAAARKLGIDVEVVRAKASELDGAFAVALAARAEAILVLVSPAFTGNRRQLVRLAAQHRLPAMYPNQSFTDAGGLIAYGPTLDEMWGLMARYVDRILKGARAAELPVEQPTRFELDINLTAARQIGIQVPQSVLVRANRVIE